MMTLKLQVMDIVNEAKADHIAEILRYDLKIAALMRLIRQRLQEVIEREDPQ